jgi:hypothetical protein
LTIEEMIGGYSVGRNRLIEAYSGVDDDDETTNIFINNRTQKRNFQKCDKDNSESRLYLKGIKVQLNSGGACYHIVQNVLSSRTRDYK